MRSNKKAAQQPIAAERIEQAAPPISATEALARNLAYQLMQAIEGKEGVDSPVARMARAMIAKAEEGDVKAGRLVFDMIQAYAPSLAAAAAGGMRGGSTTYMQQAIVADPNMLTDLRCVIVSIIAREGPQSVQALAARLPNILPSRIQAAIGEHEWFEKESDGFFHITQKARSEALVSG